LLQRIVGAVRRDGLFWIGSGNVMLDAVLVQDLRSSRLDFAALPESLLETAAERFGDERCSETP
jgi:hypothetical protein